VTLFVLAVRSIEVQVTQNWTGSIDTDYGCFWDNVERRGEPGQLGYIEAFWGRCDGCQYALLAGHIDLLSIAANLVHATMNQG
jgi:hypothetical protein